MVIRLRIFISPKPCSNKKFNSSKSDCDKEVVEVDKDTEHKDTFLITEYIPSAERCFFEGKQKSLVADLGEWRSFCLRVVPR